ncbi:MAG: GvpL/GvpF family gas vesicle protein, partial [Pseudomonadota bacterium]
LKRSAADTGIGHLQARKAQRDQRSKARADRQAFIAKLQADIGALASKVAHGAPRDARAFDCSALIPADRIAALRAFVRNHHSPAADLGFDIIVSGPWPPYDFTTTSVVPAFANVD